MKSGRNAGLGLLLVSSMLGLAACGDGGSSTASMGELPAEQSIAVVEGSVLYRERMMLPPGAQVEVQLQDISRPDALAAVLESVQFTPEGGPPYAFTIEYEPGRIDERMRYALRATITLEEQLLFTSTEYIDPFGSSPVQILVHRVPEPVSR